MTTTTDMTGQLTDIKTQFYAIMENYPMVYANFKATPDLPSARDAHDKTDAALTSLHRRMFAFQAALEKELEEQENAVGELTSEGTRLNAMVSQRSAILTNKNEMMTPNKSKATVYEPFISGLAQLQGCILDASGKPTNCPCVEAGQNSCSSKCGNCPASSTQLSLVSEARDIEKRAYIYAVCRILYLVVGIAVVSYFVFKTVKSPNSTILENAKIKADQLKTGLIDKTTGIMNTNPYMNQYVNPYLNPYLNTNANLNTTQNLNQNVNTNTNLNTNSNAKL